MIWKRVHGAFMVRLEILAGEEIATHGSALGAEFSAPKTEWIANSNFAYSANPASCKPLSIFFLIADLLDHGKEEQ